MPKTTCRSVRLSLQERQALVRSLRGRLSWMTLIMATGAQPADKAAMQREWALLQRLQRRLER